MHILGKKSKPEEEPFLGEAAQDHMYQGSMNLEVQQALELASSQSLHHTVEMIAQKEIAQEDKQQARVQLLVQAEVQVQVQALVLAFEHRLAVDDDIYR